MSRVAAGTITPEEAAARLDAIKDTEPEAETTIRKVRVIRRFGVLEIVGDPTVRDAIADGPHRARIEGDVMVFEGPSTGEESGGFFFGIGSNLANSRLRLRMNPSLGLDLQMQAGSCRVRKVEGPIRADIQAGSASIDGFTQAIDFSVQAGSLTAVGRLDGGDSRIRCDAGSVALTLERGSSARLKARATMGKIELPGNLAVTGVAGVQEVTVGDGVATVLIETNLGSVKVSADA